MSGELEEPEKVARARRRITRPSTARTLERVQRVFCEPARLQIVRALTGETLSVGDLAAVIDRKVQATSQHLRVLRQLGVVERERQGRKVYYRLCPNLLVSQLQGVINTVERTTAETG
jgi:DNA-binding transcriptional ArsR family regulator